MDSGPLTPPSAPTPADLFKQRFANVVERLCVIEAALQEKTAECDELKRQLAEAPAADG